MLDLSPSGLQNGYYIRECLPRLPNEII